MGFYTKARVLSLPHKRVVDDLLERDGEPNEESFTPYNGMHHLIYKQMVGAKYSSLDIETIKRSVDEVQFTKLNGTGDFSDKTDMETTHSIEYAMEDIDEEYLRNYIESALIGIKVNTTVARDVIKATNKVQPLMVDKETGAPLNLSDIRQVDAMEDNHLVESELKAKIPMLLKKLQNGSINYGVSLLSLLIAKDRATKLYDKRGFDIKPRHLLECDIYRVSGDGSLLDTFDAETANNIPKFKEAKDIIMGVNPNDVYYKAGCDLISRLNRLGLNLYEEDVQEFTPTYINHIMCSYIYSNQEVLSDMSSVDPSIMKMLEDGSVFTAPDNESMNRSTNRVIELKEMAKLKMRLVPSVHDYLDTNGITFNTTIKPEILVDEFLRRYKEINTKATMEESSISDCVLDYYTVCDSACNGPIIFRLDQFVMGMGSTPLFDNIYGIVTNRGFIIRIDNSIEECVISHVTSVLEYVKDLDVDKMWKLMVPLCV